MASENLAKLQATVNRFSDRADFSPLAIDGGMGSKTANAIITTLAWVAANVQAETDTAGALVVKLSPNNVPDQTQIMQSNTGINTYLSQVADSLELGPAATVALVKPQAPNAPGSSVIPTPDKSAFKVGAPANAGLFDKTRLWYRQLPMYQQAGVGVGAGILLLLGITRFRKSKKGA